MNSRFRTLIAFTVSLLLVNMLSCSWKYDRLRQEVQEQRAKWQEHGITTYSYRFSRYCYCPQDYVGPFRVFVVENKVDSIFSYVDSMEVRDTLDEFTTIDGLFDLLESEIDRKPADIWVQFDDDYHFPSRVRIDNIQAAIDDETGFNVDDLVVFSEN
jgi:hypothetical protein